MYHDEIQRRYKDHIYFSYMNAGGAKKLVGDVIVFTFLVTDPDSKWSKEDEERCKKTQKSAMASLVDSARKRGVDLRIRHVFDRITMDTVSSRENRHEMTKAAAKKYRKNNLREFQKYCKNYYRCDELPILFVFNKPFRSSAQNVDVKRQDYHDEYSRISLGTARTFAHELLHQFGAADLYYPRELKELVKNMNYPSIMAAGSKLDVDSLNAYLIGWTREIDADAVRILEKTKHLTPELMAELIRREWESVWGNQKSFLE